jgi:hypothetical protein
MELLSALRLLARHRLLIALGVLLAAVMGAAAGGAIAVGPLGGPPTRSAIATTEIQIDTPRPLAADLRAAAATIEDQSIMLAERLTADDTTAVVARHAGVPVEDLAVVSSRTAISGRTSAAARAAVDAAATPTSRYRLTVSSTSDSPIISLLAAAPDADTAARLAEAAAPAVESVIDAAPDTVRQRLVVRPLAPPATKELVSGGPKPLLGAIAAPIVFLGWCWLVIVAIGLMRALRRDDRPAARPAQA